MRRPTKLTSSEKTLASKEFANVTRAGIDGPVDLDAFDKFREKYNRAYVRLAEKSRTSIDIGQDMADVINSDLELSRLTYGLGHLQMGIHNVTVVLGSAERPPRFEPCQNTSLFLSTTVGEPSRAAVPEAVPEEPALAAAAAAGEG